MPSYDDLRFSPPAPVARVTLRNPGTGTEVSDVSLLIDSGADVTLLPRSAVEAIGLTASPGDECELTGFDGNKTLAPVVILEMVFLGRNFRGRFLLIEEDLGVLGRNVLNQLSLLLDGPSRHWSEPGP